MTTTTRAGSCRSPAVDKLSSDDRRHVAALVESLPDKTPPGQPDGQ
jgi:hypothetical protein